MTTRELPPEEWHKLADQRIEPFATYGLPAPENWRILVAEEGDRIIGVSDLYQTIHNDWWIAEDQRKNPGLIRALWRETKGLLDRAGISFIHATVSDDQPDVQALVQKLGYLPAPGKLFLLHVPDAVLNEEEK